jgi:chromosome segregation ATPase
MKKLLVIGLVVLAGLWVARRTHLASYACTLWSNVRTEAKNQVPVKFELDRIRHEIAQMDGDIRNMVGPLAEHQAGINELRRSIDETRGKMVQQKAGLLSLTACLDKGGDQVEVNHQRVPAARVRSKMQRDFSNYKLLQSKVATQEKLLAAKEKAFDAAREQLNKLIAKQRDFKVQVEQLAAEQQLIEAAGTGTDLRVDDSRASDIQSTLNDIRHRQEVARNTMTLLSGQLVTDNLQADEQAGATTDEVRNYLQGNAPNPGPQTASRK